MSNKCKISVNTCKNSINCLFFVSTMGKKYFSFVTFLSTIILLFGLISCADEQEQDDFSEHVKVTLRIVGSQLLNANKDSTSLVLPIIALENSKYSLSFQKSLAINPDDLVKTINKSFENGNLPKHFRVEVKSVKNGEVAYSYEVREAKNSDIIPCRGRLLDLDNYMITIQFLDQIPPVKKNNKLYYLFIIPLVIIVIYKYRKKTIVVEEHTNEVLPHETIGLFQFFPEQSKLVKSAEVIRLSKKECELLLIFAAKPNQIITREELTKKVWEDNGVFVGRSLDTYISKLRKILKTDTSISIENVHGVGYKLNIES